MRLRDRKGLRFWSKMWSVRACGQSERWISYQRAEGYVLCGGLPPHPKQGGEPPI